MSWTKLKLIQQAYEELGLGSYVFDLQPEQLSSAASRMDAMIASWENGARLGYDFSAGLADESGIPDFANKPVYLGLAVNLAPTIGKVINPMTLAEFTTSKAAMMNKVALPVMERQLPATMPRGQGNKPWRTNRNPYFTEPKDTIDTGPDGELEFE